MLSDSQVDCSASLPIRFRREFTKSSVNIVTAMANCAGALLEPRRKEAICFGMLYGLHRRISNSAHRGDASADMPNAMDPIPGFPTRFAQTMYVKCSIRAGPYIDRHHAICRHSARRDYAER